MDPSTWNKRVTASILVLGLALAGILLARHNGRHDVGFFEDDAYYVLGAQSLRSGTYSDLSSPGHPPEVHFLPGFSAFLVPTVAALGVHVEHLRWVPFALALLAAALGFLYLRKGWGERTAALGVALFLLHPLTVFLSDVLISEWWLLCLSLAAFLLSSTLVAGKGNGLDRAMLASVLVWAALTRPEGILLSLAIGVEVLRRRTAFKGFHWILPWPFLALLGWFLRNQTLTHQWSTYAPIWNAPTLSHLVSTLFLGIGGLLSAGTRLNGSPGILEGTLGGLLFLSGTLTLRGRKDAAFEKAVAFVYFGLFMLVRLCWPVNEPRFFLMVLPIWIAFSLEGLAQLRQRLPPWVAATAAVLVGALVAFQTTRIAITPRQPTDKIPQATLAYLRLQAPPGQPVATNRLGLLRLYTGLQGVSDLRADSPDEWLYHLVTRGVQWVWIRREPIADKAVEARWMRANRWTSTWPTAFETTFDSAEELSTIYRVHVAPHFTEAFKSYEVARQAWQEGKRDEGEKAFARALALAPEFPGALNDYASLLIEKGQLSQAKPYLMKAIALRPTFALAALNLSRVALLSGHRPEAEQWLRRAEQNAFGERDITLAPLFKKQREAL